MIPATFEYAVPETLKDAVALLSTSNSRRIGTLLISAACSGMLSLARMMPSENPSQGHSAIASQATKGISRPDGARALKITPKTTE